MSTPISEGRVRSTYQFINGNRHQYSVQMMCRVLGVAPSGYYLWRAHEAWPKGASSAPVSSRSISNLEMTLGR